MSIVEGWITIQDATGLTGYSPKYVRQLVNQRRIPARKVGRDWLVHRDSLLAHRAQMDDMGKSKHNPWRADLVALGRGRRPQNPDSDGGPEGRELEADNERGA